MSVNIHERVIDPQTGKLTLEGYKMLVALENRLDAIAAVAAPSGGATVDAEARAAVAAMIAASG